ncbi:MAG: GerMN domain-containing protein [Microbacteriaceae bacterium]
MHSRFRRWAGILGLIVVPALTLGLAGCVGIPRSGAVHAGQPIVQADSNGFDLNYSPSGPVTGATQEEILRGFIDAASSPQQGYAVAREFLAPDFSSSWQPDESVTVDRETGRDYSQLDATTMQLAVSPVADVDVSGNYTTVNAAAPVIFRYQFVSVTINKKKEWRLKSAPNGTVLDQTKFASVFTAHPLYFYSPDFSYLVPDLRWFPSRASTATRIVKALLAGAAPWLAKAVVSAFPNGTQLSLDSVPVNASRAQVDLSAEANGADQATMQRMVLQLSKSLIDVTSVSSIEVSIQGNQKSVEDLAPGSGPITDPPVDIRPLVLRNGQFGLLSTNGSDLKQLPGLSAKVAALKPQAVTVSADQSAAAVLAAGGVYSVSTAADTPALVDARPGLIPPSLDVYGYLWSVPAALPGQLHATAPDGAAVAVQTPWPDASSIVSLQVARDGTRLIALLRSGTDTRLVAASIVRGGERNAPRQLGPLMELTAGSGTPRAATWVDELTVATLTTTRPDGSAVAVQQLGGQNSSVAGPNHAVTLVGAGTVPRYWLLTSDNTLQGPRGTGWQQKADDIDLIATQLGTPVG